MTLRELFEGDKVTYGGWCVIPSAFSAELIGRCGYDWVCIDNQHGLIGYEQTTGMLQALSLTGTPSFVRVPWSQPDHIMKALDAGAQGIIVPMVGSAEDAKRAVECVKYPPAGYRSWGPIRASLEVEGYTSTLANQRTVVALMIETPDGVKNMDQIMKVEGVDAIYVGPADLGLSHGMQPALGVPNGSDHEGLILSILEGCKRNGVTPGIHTDGAVTAARWRQAGFRMLTVSTDGALMRRAATQALSDLRGPSTVLAPAGSQYT
jgi:4-hydroxy-2-oxoheptanedioate aldolase